MQRSSQPDLIEAPGADIAIYGGTFSSIAGDAYTYNYAAPAVDDSGTFLWLRMEKTKVLMKHPQASGPCRRA